MRILVSEVAELSHLDIHPREFFDGFLTRVVQAMAAVGGAVWLLEQPKPWIIRWWSGRTLRPTSTFNVPAELIHGRSRDAREHRRSLLNAVRWNTELVLPPQAALTEEQIGGNPTHQLLLVNPLCDEAGNPVGLVEIFQRPNENPVTRKGYAVFLKQMCELGNQFLRRISDRERRVHSSVATAKHQSLTGG